eukprot:364173-Chlamydomonas_euryale.AAC.15
MALIFANKIAVVPENVFSKCFNDRLVTKGTMLEFMTLFFQEFTSIQGISTDDLVSLLVKSKISSRLLDLFPPLNRSYDEFNRHFNDAGLSDLVLWNSKEIMALKHGANCIVPAQQRNPDTFVSTSPQVTAIV